MHFLIFVLIFTEQPPPTAREDRWEVKNGELFAAETGTHNARGARVSIRAKYFFGFVAAVPGRLDVGVGHHVS